MKAQALTEISLIPWMQLLAVLIGLVILFFLGSVRVQAGLSPAGVHKAAPMARPTDCLPTNGAGNFGNVWYVDVTDISNESVQGSKSSKAKMEIKREKDRQIKTNLIQKKLRTRPNGG